MSQVLWIQPESPTSEAIPDDLFWLLKASNSIDELCKKLEVEKLSKFHDNSEAAAELGLDIDPVISAPKGLLRTLESLLANLDSGSVKMDDDTVAQIKRELGICVTVARSCEERNDGVRLILVG